MMWSELLSLRLGQIQSFGTIAYKDMRHLWIILVFSLHKSAITISDHLTGT